MKKTCKNCFWFRKFTWFYGGLCTIHNCKKSKNNEICEQFKSKVLKRIKITWLERK